MAKSIPAIVTPEVLQWARSLDRITLEEIAQKLKVEATKVEAWENGSEHPTLAQAKSLAKQYRVPFAFFLFTQYSAKNQAHGKGRLQNFWQLGRRRNVS